MEIVNLKPVLSLLFLNMHIALNNISEMQFRNIYLKLPLLIGYTYRFSTATIITRNQISVQVKTSFIQFVNCTFIMIHDMFSTHIA